MSHSVLRVVLTPQISNLIQTPIFRSGWVVGITPYAQFCPFLFPHFYIFYINSLGGFVLIFDTLLGFKVVF